MYIRTSRSRSIPTPSAECIAGIRWCASKRLDQNDRYGDIFVDTNLSFAVYQRWKALTRPAPGPGGLRRPLWIPRVVRPAESAYYITEPEGVSK